MRILLTGASGFLGGAVGRAAAAAGHRMIALGRNAEGGGDWREEYRAVDFFSEAALAAAVREAAPECVMHFAGTASVADSLARPADDFESSTRLWFAVLNAIRASGFRPLTVFASSAAVYGSPRQLPTPEDAPLNPESPYGFHKAMAELAGREFATCYGLPVAALRYFSVFGPRQRRLLVWEIFNQISHGADVLRLKGTGEERRDFLAEDEAAGATVALAEALAAREPAGGFCAVNIASGVSRSVREVAESVCAAAGRGIPVVFGRDEIPGNPSRWQADVAELRRRVPGWTPRPFEKSLAKCVAAWDSARAADALR